MRDLPQIKMAGVARRGHGQSLLVCGAIESGANVCFAVGQRGEGNFEGTAGWQAVELTQQESDNALVLACPALRDRILLNQLDLL